VVVLGLAAASSEQAFAEDGNVEITGPVADLSGTCPNLQ
jgi:hypothetical protein